MVRILPVRQRLRKQPVLQQILHVPFRRALRFPGPKDPAGALLVGVQLRFDVAPDIKLVVGRQVRDGAGVKPGSEPSYRAPFPRPLSHLVQLPTISSGTDSGRSGKDELCQRPAPFAHDGPFVRIPQRRALSTRRLDVLRGSQIDFPLTENLIPVHVQHDVILAGAGAHEPIPILNPLKRIMEDHHGVSLWRLQPDRIVITFEVKIFHQIHIQGEPEGFVQ